MENPELGAGSVLDQLEKEFKKITRWELCRVVKDLRKYRRFKMALEVYDWMNERKDKFTLSSSDAAIRLDLISKVQGIAKAEEYFSTLSGTLKDKRTYGSLLNAYVKAMIKNEAESLFEEIKTKGYAVHSLPYNVMMTMYMKLKDYDKVFSMVSEMIERKIPLDSFSYNIWLTACGATQATDKMEEVAERMKTDSTVSPDWSTYTTMATAYMNLNQMKKAMGCLRMVEGKITGRVRIPFHYLLSLYGGIGEREEVYRIWNTYKTSFPRITNLGYHSMISSLIRLDDIEGAERIYAEWLPNRQTSDPRVCNLLISWYVKNGLLEKAEDFLNKQLEAGGKANAFTWETLAVGHIDKGRIPEALSYTKKATLAEGGGKYWKPNPAFISSFLSLCEQESDAASTKTFIDLLTEAGIFENGAYRSMISRNAEGEFQVKIFEDEAGDDSAADLLLNELEKSL